ncbi:MAG: ABC transporter ATP-binding protein [Desulfovibrionaceae bacterium]|nr:ABC transporter ATP-binding protein [Desulfovibrionaceae bacterium]
MYTSPHNNRVAVGQIAFERRDLAFGYARTDESNAVIDDLNLKIAPSDMALSPHRKHVEVEQIAIECRNLTFAYDRTESNAVIADLNLTVTNGEILCVLGASGCGKTSLLNLVAGFLTPQHGTVVVNGVPVSGPGPDRGVVFQEYSLFPWLTALGNVEFSLAMQGMSRKARRQAAIAKLNLVGLEHAIDRYPFELSGGMKQRVAIARTLAANPQVLLMDEPFAALDALTRSSLQEELLTIYHKTKTTIIFVTHNIAEAIKLGDRLIVLGPGGKILESIENGRPSRVDPAYGESYRRLARALNVEDAE